MFQFGPKIFDKINDKINPEFPDEEPCDVFDLWEGANFRLRAHTVNKQRSYDKSTFETPSELFDGDETKLKPAYDSLPKLHDLLKESEFKSETELQARFNQTIGLKSSTKSDTSYSHDDDIPAPPTKRDYEPQQSTSNSDDSDLDEYYALLNN